MKTMITGIVAALALLLLSAPAGAADMERGGRLYDKYCAGCHGVDGDGFGAAADYLNPPPRAFTEGIYKWRSTPAEAYSPTAEDFTRLILGPHTGGIPGWTGLAGTSMPGWEGVVDNKDAADIAAYIMDMGGLEAAEYDSVKMPAGGGPTPEAIERGRKIFGDLCTECHGQKGRGDATKRLKDDWGARTWPRNLTKGWTFRMGSSPEEVYRRVTVGIPGTQMPSFADPESKKYLSDNERADVAYYIATLDDKSIRPDGERTIRAVRASAKLPGGPDDPVWQSAPATNLFLAPQIVMEDRLYTPTIDSVTMRALYDDTDIAMLLEWDDPTLSLPGDRKSGELAEGELYSDAVAIEFPAMVGPGASRTPFAMGSASRPVEIWRWQGPEAEASDSATTLIARGTGDISGIDGAGLTSSAAYIDGRWSVVMKRPLDVGLSNRVRFAEGEFTPVAFAAWDGSNGETGARHTMTTWCTLVLEGGGGGGWGFGVVIWPVAAFVVVGVLELLVVASIRRREREKEG